MQRIHDIYRPTEKRKSDWREVERMLSEEELKEQASRCMNCGQPFCHAYGCPLGNLVPDQNRFRTGEIAAPPIHAKGKDVLVIGGGDTGSDCVGTAIRHGAKSVTQIEIMPKPPDARDASTPWPLWPYMLRTSSSHKEGCARRWNLNTLRFIGTSCLDRVAGVEVETVEWDFSPEGKPVKFHTVPQTKEMIKADLVFLAMGFTGVPADNPILSQLGLKQTPRTTLVSEAPRNIFCVGDCANGASLVVRALASGKSPPLD